MMILVRELKTVLPLLSNGPSATVVVSRRAENDAREAFGPIGSNSFDEISSLSNNIGDVKIELEKFLAIIANDRLTLERKKSTVLTPISGYSNQIRRNIQNVVRYIWSPAFTSEVIRGVTSSTVSIIVITIVAASVSSAAVQSVMSKILEFLAKLQ